MRTGSSTAARGGTPGPSATTIVPGIGSLPKADLAGFHIVVSVTKVLAPTELVVNGYAATPPTAQSEPVVVEMTITPTAGGAVIPVASFAFAAENAVAATAGLGQIVYYGGPGGGPWSQYTAPYQGVPPRLVLGPSALTVWAVGWVEKPESGPPSVAILWDGTASGRAGGGVAVLPGRETVTFSLRTQV